MRTTRGEAAAMAAGLGIAPAMATVSVMAYGVQVHAAWLGWPLAYTDVVVWWVGVATAAVTFGVAAAVGWWAGGQHGQR